MSEVPLYLGMARRPALPPSLTAQIDVFSLSDPWAKIDESRLFSPRDLAVRAGSTESMAQLRKGAQVRHRVK